jgi:hypothetical protein
MRFTRLNQEEPPLLLRRRARRRRDAVGQVGRARRRRGAVGKVGPAPIQHPVFMEAGSRRRGGTSRDLLDASPEVLRKMILEKISETEVEADSAKSSIAENERLIAKNRAMLAMSQGEIAKLREQLVLLGNISEVIPPKKKEHIVQSAEQKMPQRNL